MRENARRGASHVLWSEREGEGYHLLFLLTSLPTFEIAASVVEVTGVDPMPADDVLHPRLARLSQSPSDYALV